MFVHYTLNDPKWGLIRNQFVPMDRIVGGGFPAALRFIEANPRWWEEDRQAVGTVMPYQHTTAPGTPSSIFTRPLSWSINGRLMNESARLDPKQASKSIAGGVYITNQQKSTGMKMQVQTQ
jgi:hypothetical protein